MSDRLTEALLSALKQEVRRIGEEEADRAAERTRERVKAALGHIAVSLYDHYTIERFGRELVLRVQHEGRGRP